MFVKDLKSSWGTKVNKQSVKPDEYIELKDGDILQFGESTRTYLVIGPQEASEEENPELQEKLNQIYQADTARKIRLQN